MRLGSFLSTFYVFSLPFFLATCSQATPPAPKPAAEGKAAPVAAPAVLAEAECSNPKVRVQVTEVARSGPESVTVKFRLLNPDRTAPVALGSAFADGADTGSLSGVFVLDASGQKKVFVLRNDRGEPQCSTDLAQLAPGAHADAWARYPMPVPGAARLTVQVPGLPPFRDLPVADQPRGTAPAGPSY